ncbi:MAG TPA: SMC-Scp complex subunit ScpB [Bacteroidota bacterium]
MPDRQVITEEPGILRVPSSLKRLIEALIFAADEPLSVKQIKAIYEQQSGEEGRNIEQEEIQQAIGALNEEYKAEDRPYRIIAVAGGFQFATLPEYAEWLGRLHREQSRRKLSQSSLETLAMVAYKQPISKPEIEAIRGVNCDYVLKTLLEKELVTIVGRADTVGRPLLYGTTREFLKHFGLNEVTDLPRPREIEEILGESQFETERRMLEAQAGAEQMKKEEEDFPSRLPHIPKKKPVLDEQVQIIPKGRARKLNVKPAERDAEFVAPTAEKETPTAPEPEVVEPPAGKTSEKAVASPVEETMEALGEHHEKSAPAEIPAAHRNDLPLAANKQQLDEVVQIAHPDSSSPQEPEMTQPRRSRWTGWKEKIQTFIRKLFG